MKKFILMSFICLNLENLMASESPSYSVTGTTVDPVCNVAETIPMYEFVVNNVTAGLETTLTFNPANNSCTADNGAQCNSAGLPTYTVSCSSSKILNVEVKSGQDSFLDDEFHTHTLIFDTYSHNYTGASATSHTIRLGARVRLPSTLLASTHYTWHCADEINPNVITGAITISF